jgi:hypothetical protein
VGFNLDDYEPVAARHSRWLAQHPNGRTITHMVSTPGSDICVIRAELWLEDVCIATGLRRRSAWRWQCKPHQPRREL